MTLDIAWLDEAPSTMSVATELLRTKSPPFAVVAARQTEGQGSYGRSWQSPVGNFYATLVLPGQSYSPERFPLTLLTGLAIAHFLEENWAVKATVKWPNDLLLGGRKLGGILTQMIGQGEQSAIVIGVGLNIHQAPDLPGGEHRAVALAEYNLAPMDSVESWGKELLVHLQAVLTKAIATGNNAWQKSFDRYGTAVGSLWQNRQSAQWATQQKLSATGAMMLKPVDQENSVTLNSVDHAWYWHWQNPSRHTAIADMGHSATKLWWPLQPDRPVWQLTIAEQESQTFAKLLEQLQPSAPLYCGAVNQPALVSLQKSLNHHRPDVPLVVIAKRTTLLVAGQYSWDKLGLDRLAGMEAALQQTRGDSLKVARPLLVVSCGTATTIDVVAKDRCHAGGYILPGVSLGRKALAQQTTLPAVATGDCPSPNSNALPQATAAAIFEGCLASAVGAVSWIAERARRSWGEPPHVILTGGHAPSVAAYANRSDWQVHPLLIVQGLRALAQSG